MTTYRSKVGGRKVTSSPSNLGGITTKVCHDGIDSIRSIKNSRHGHHLSFRYRRRWWCFFAGAERWSEPKRIFEKLFKFHNSYQPARSTSMSVRVVLNLVAEQPIGCCYYNNLDPNYSYLNTALWWEDAQRMIDQRGVSWWGHRLCLKISRTFSDRNL
jgi:hypothetical protein